MAYLLTGVVKHPKAEQLPMIWWLFKGTRENSWKAMTQWMWILNSWNFLSLIRKNIQDLPTRNTWYSWISRLTTQPSCLCLVHLPPPNVTPLRNTALLRETYIVNKPWSQGRLFLGGVPYLEGGGRLTSHHSWTTTCLVDSPGGLPVAAAPGTSFAPQSNAYRPRSNVRKRIFWGMFVDA